MVGGRPGAGINKFPFFQVFGGSKDEQLYGSFLRDFPFIVDCLGWCHISDSY